MDRLVYIICEPEAKFKYYSIFKIFWTSPKQNHFGPIEGQGMKLFGKTKTYFAVQIVTKSQLIYDYHNGYYVLLMQIKSA